MGTPYSETTESLWSRLPELIRDLDRKQLLPVLIPAVQGATNEATNPALKTPSGTVEIDRNLATNPSATGTGGYLSNNTPLYPMSHDTTIYRSGSASFRGTNAAGGGATLISCYALGMHNNSKINVTPGEVLTLAAYFRPNISGCEAQVTCIWYDSGGGGVSGPAAPFHAVPVGEWTKVTFTVTVPANAANFYPMAQCRKISGNATPGDYANVDDVLIVKAPSAPDFFDGETPDDGTFTYQWVGAANASESTKTAPGIASWSMGVSGVARFYHTADGGVLHSRGAAYAVARVNLPSASFSVDDVVTAMWEVEALDNCSIVAFIENAGSSATRTYSPSITLVAGEKKTIEVEHTVQIGGTGAWFYVGFHSPAASGQTARLRVRRILIVKGAYSGEMFDGDTQDSRYEVDLWSWEGTPHASRSVQVAHEGQDAGYPMKKYIGSITDIAGQVEAMLERIDYNTVINGGVEGDTSDLIDAVNADSSWFRWIAMMRGVRINLNGDENSQRQELIAAGVYNTGTKADIAKTAAQGLSGSKLVRVVPRSTTVEDQGTKGVWDVLIITRATETPPGYDPVQRVIDAGAKPAGIRLHHDTFQGTWDAFEAQYPNWNAIDAATWDEIEEAGLE